MRSCPLTIALVGLLILGASSLKLPRVVVPASKHAGQTATLECPFDLERDRLYDVKWYKDNVEFLRYTPKKSPPMKQVQLAGVHVQMSGSNSKQVILQNLEEESTGMYRCEVSAQGPSFASAHKEARMVVHSRGEGEEEDNKAARPAHHTVFILLQTFLTVLLNM